MSKKKNYEIRDSNHPVLSFVPSGGIICLEGCLGGWPLYTDSVDPLQRIVAEIKWEGETFREVVTFTEYQELAAKIEWLVEFECKL